MKCRQLPTTQVQGLNAESRPPPGSLTPPSELLITLRCSVSLRTTGPDQTRPQTKLCRFQSRTAEAQVKTGRLHALCQHLHPAPPAEEERRGDTGEDPLALTPAPALAPRHRPPLAPRPALQKGRGTNLLLFVFC